MKMILPALLKCTSLLLSAGFMAAADAQTPTPPVSSVESLKEAQPWTDKTGRVLIGVAKSFDGKQAVFVLTKEQREVTVPAEQLSAVSLTALRVLFSPPPSEPPAAPAVAAIAVADTDALKAALNTEVTIEGKVRDASALNGGHVRIRFDGTDGFVLFILKRNVDASPDWNFDALAGKTVRVKGKVVEYQGKLEIVPEKPEQIVKLD